MTAVRVPLSAPATIPFRVLSRGAGFHRTLSGAIIAIAKKLDITVIAEFVRSKEVFNTCVELGVDEFQGFYLGEPRDSLYED